MTSSRILVYFELLLLNYFQFENAEIPFRIMIRYRTLV